MSFIGNKAVHLDCRTMTCLKNGVGRLIEVAACLSASQCMLRHSYVQELYENKKKSDYISSVARGDHGI